MVTNVAESTEYGDLPRSVRLVARLIPARERESVVGDLLEDAAYRGFAGVRATVWLAGECAAVGAGLSIDRARAWIVMPPVREVVSGLAVDARGALHDGAGGTVLRACVFVASIATLVLGVELLVGSLMSAAGF